MKRLALHIPLTVASTLLQQGGDRPVRPVPPPDAETTCGPLRHGPDDLLVWATSTEARGLEYFLGRYDHRGVPRGDPLDVGHGYDGNPVCVVAAHRRRIAIVFPFIDPYGGTPALTLAIVEHDRIVVKRDIVKLFCWDLEPVSIRSTRDGGWVVRYRCGDDAAIERIALDPGGRER